MITAFEVGAVLRLIDEASPALAGLSRKFEAFDLLLGKINAKFDALQKLLREPLPAVSGAGVLTNLDAAIQVSLDRVAALKTALAEVGGESKLLSLPAPSGGGPGGGGRVPTGTPGTKGEGIKPYAAFGAGGKPALGASMGSMWAWALPAIGIWDSVKQAAGMEDVMAKWFQIQQTPTGHRGRLGNSGQWGPGGMVADPRYIAAKRMLQEVSITTGGDLPDLEKDFYGISLLLQAPLVDKAGQSHQMTIGNQMGVMKKLLLISEREALHKNTSAEAAGKATLEILHQADIFGDDPKVMDAALSAIAYASVMSPRTLPQLQTQLGYAQPFLKATQGAGLEDMMSMVVAMSQVGINQKGGTWIKNLFDRSLPTGGKTKHDRAVTRELNLLGLASGDEENPTANWMVNGKPDYDLALRLIQTKLKSASPQERKKMLEVLGSTGASGAALLSPETMIARLESTREGMHRFNEDQGKVFGQILEDSPLRKFKSEMNRVNAELMDVGETTLPFFVQSLHYFNEGMKSIKDILTGNTSLSPELKDKIENAPWWMGGRKESAQIGQAIEGAASGIWNWLTSPLANQVPKSPFMSQGAVTYPGVGVIPQAYHPSPFTNIGESLGGAGSSGSGGPVDIIYAGTLHALKDWTVWGGGSAGGGEDHVGGGAGGTAFGGLRRGHGGHGGAMDIVHGGGPSGSTARLTGVSNAEREAKIKAYAISIGKDPNFAWNVALNEGG